MPDYILLREGEGKVACGRFLRLLQGAGGDSTARNCANKQKATQLLAAYRRLVRR